MKLHELLANLLQSRERNPLPLKSAKGLDRNNWSGVQYASRNRILQLGAEGERPQVLHLKKFDHRLKTSCLVNRRKDFPELGECRLNRAQGFCHLFCSERCHRCEGRVFFYHRCLQGGSRQVENGNKASHLDQR